MRICIGANKKTTHQILEFLGLQNNFEVEVFSHSLKLLEAFRGGTKWDMVYVSEDLLQIKGSALAQLLKYDDPNLPVVLLNGFDKQELCTQLNDILKKLELRETFHTLPYCNTRLKNFVFNAQKSMVYKKGEPIKLRKKEAQLLEYLLRYKDKLVTKQTLLEAVWLHKYNHTSHTVSSHIAQLRRKIGFDVVQIKNLPRQGYLLTQSI